MVRLSKEHLAKLQKMAELDDRSATNYLERMIEINYKKIMEELKMSNYGTVDFKGETYTLLCDAWIDNYGSNGDYRYYAKAELNGKKYLVAWDTTKEWDDATKLYGLIEKRDNCDKANYQNEWERLTEEIIELEEKGVNPLIAEDQSNACDWENPISVEEID